MKLLVAISVYVVGVIVYLISSLILAEVRQNLKLDPPVHFYYTGRIETHGADEMAVFGALFTSLLSWVGVIFLLIPGAVWTVQDIRKRHREVRSKEKKT